MGKEIRARFSKGKIELLEKVELEERRRDFYHNEESSFACGGQRRLPTGGWGVERDLGF